MKNAFLLAVCFILTFIALRGEDSYTPRGFHKHDGFYLSFSGGPIIGDIREESNNDFISKDVYIYSGTGVFLDAKIGGRVDENLLLHATIISSSIAGATVGIEWSGDKENLPLHSSFDETMFGFGITYYFMPQNYFLSLSTGLGFYSYSEGSASNTSDLGIGFQLKLGKEWWISPNWGLGIGLSMSSTLAPTPYTNLSSGRYAIVFNTTYN